MHGYIDISVRLGSGHIDYPGDPPYERNPVHSLEAGDGCTLSRLCLSAHSGTHLDAPSHFLADGRPICGYPLSRFVLYAQVLALPAVPLILAEHLPAQLPEGGALLFKTDNSYLDRLSRPYDPAYVGVSESAARRLAESGLSLVGIDYLSIDPKGTDGHPAHIILLSRDILILEGLDLRKVDAGHYTLYCPPLSLAGSEAAPTRAFLGPAPSTVRP